MCAFDHLQQVWRLVTNFMFFGLFSLDFLFHMYFVYVALGDAWVLLTYLQQFLTELMVVFIMSSVRYCRLLEEGSFRGRTADFVYMLLLGAVVMIVRPCDVGWE